MTENQEIISAYNFAESYLDDLFNFTDNTSEFDLEDYDLSDYLADIRADLYRHRDPFTIVLMIFFTLVFLLGLLSNLFVIIVVAKHRTMRTLTNVFFLNLTIGDLLVVCVCMPITLGNYVYRDWIYGEVFCKINSFLQGTAVGVSVLSMLFISVNRYFAIHTPIKAKLLFTRKKVTFILIVIWVLSSGVVTPMLFVNVLTPWGFPGIFESNICEEKWNDLADKQMYNIAMFLLQFFLPLLVMGVTYMKISITLWNEDETLYHGGPSGKMQAERILRIRRRTVRNLIFLVTLFGCSWLPYYITNIWLDFTTDADNAALVSKYVYPIVQLFGLSNSMVNPLCYCFLSNGFRKALVNMCCIHKKRTPQGTIVSVRYKIPTSDDSCFESNETVLN